jgi:hypothetical protein
MPIDDGPSPIGRLLEGLTEFLDEAAEEQPQGWVMVERMRVAMPVEFYVRSAPEDAGRVWAVESRPASSMLTSVSPVLHGLSLVVEVDSAERREPGVES